MHIETQCLHEGYQPGNGDPKALPIYQSTTYTYDSTDHIGQLFEVRGIGAEIFGSVPQFSRSHPENIHDVPPWQQF